MKDTEKNHIDEWLQKQIKKGRRLVVNSNAIRALLIRSIQNLFSNQKELSTKMNEHLEGLKIFYYECFLYFLSFSLLRF